MTPPKMEQEHHCQGLEDIAVLKAEKKHTEKAIEKMEKELEQISEAVSRVEVENRDIKRIIEDQGKKLDQIAAKLEGTNGGGKVPGLVAGGNLERLMAAGSGIAGSLGWSLLFLAMVGIVNKPVAFQIVQWVFKIIGVII